MPVSVSTQLKCLLQWAEPTRSLIDTGGGYHSRSAKFMNHHNVTLSIQYSLLSPNCPTRSRIIQQEPIENVIRIEPPS
jgi:hypothetical protein